MKKFWKRYWTTVFLVLILLTGFCLLLYPTVSDWWNEMHQSRAISTYVESVTKISDEEIAALLEEAEEYNRVLAKNTTRLNMTAEELETYNGLLDLNGTGIMGYLEIPVINVHLPIYHGTDESVLQVAAGHISWSSLPVGGESTHTAISGHRGLPSAKLLSDLDKVVEGDIFTISVLGRTLTYMVDQIRIVQPEDISELAIKEGEDYCTLITCTPYGVNTHRMLVRGTRIDNIEDAVVIVSEAVRMEPYLVAFAIGIPLILIVLLFIFIYYRIRLPRMGTQQLLEEFRR